jgi:hypothetical protein
LVLILKDETSMRFLLPFIGSVVGNYEEISANAIEYQGILGDISSWFLKFLKSPLKHFSNSPYLDDISCWAFSSLTIIDS